MPREWVGAGAEEKVGREVEREQGAQDDAARKEALRLFEEGLPEDPDELFRMRAALELEQQEVDRTKTTSPLRETSREGRGEWSALAEHVHAINRKLNKLGAQEK